MSLIGRVYFLSLNAFIKNIQFLNSYEVMNWALMPDEYDSLIAETILILTIYDSI